MKNLVYTFILLILISCSGNRFISDNKRESKETQKELEYVADFWVQNCMTDSNSVSHLKYFDYTTCWDEHTLLLTDSLIKFYKKNLLSNSNDLQYKLSYEKYYHLLAKSQNDTLEIDFYFTYDRTLIEVEYSFNFQESKSLFPYLNQQRIKWLKRQKRIIEKE